MTAAPRKDGERDPRAIAYLHRALEREAHRQLRCARASGLAWLKGWPGGACGLRMVLNSGRSFLSLEGFRSDFFMGIPSLSRVARMVMNAKLCGTRVSTRSL